MSYSALTHSEFKFREIKVTGSGVEAEFSEAEGWGIFKNIAVYTMGENKLYSMYQHTKSTVEENGPAKYGRENMRQLRHGFLAVRDKKATLGLRFEVEDPEI